MVNVSPPTVVNSSTPDNVMTYWGIGSLCQSKVECGAVSLKWIDSASTNLSPFTTPGITCEFPSGPVKSRYARIIFFLLGIDIVDVQNGCCFSPLPLDQCRTLNKRL